MAIPVQAGAAMRQGHGFGREDGNIICLPAVVAWWGIVASVFAAFFIPELSANRLQTQVNNRLQTIETQLTPTAERGSIALPDGWSWGDESEIEIRVGVFQDSSSRLVLTLTPVESDPNEIRWIFQPAASSKGSTRAFPRAWRDQRPVSSQDPAKRGRLIVLAVGALVLLLGGTVVVFDQFCAHF